MAQLFQPTNIYPDMRGPVGNGILFEPTVIFDWPTVHVSWQVNGNTAMTAFQVDFYENDGSGDLIYSTGKRTDQCPFYGMNQNGTVNIFNYVFELDDYTGDEPFYDHKEGQMVITQWWGDGANDYVVQSSPSVYVVKNIVDSFVQYNGSTVWYATITTKNATFTGYFTGQGDDGFTWIRWKLYNPDGNLLKDTGKMYGPVELSFSYDGFLPGQYYSIELSGETESGVVCNGGSSRFIVDYDIAETTIDVSAYGSCSGENAVEVTWPLVASIPLNSFSGMYSMGKNAIALGESASLKWDRINVSSMNIRNPWTLVWCGTVTGKKDYITPYTSWDFLRISFTSGTVGATLLSFSAEEQWGTKLSLGCRVTYLTSGGSTMTQYLPMNNPSPDPKYLYAGGKLWIAVTSTAIYVAYESTESGDIYPSESLYPSDGLYPGNQGVIAYQIPVNDNTSQAYGWSSKSITGIEVLGESSIDYVKVFNQAISNDEFRFNYANFDSNPVQYNAGTRFLLAPNEENTYDAGNFRINELEVTVSGTGITSASVDKDKFNQKAGTSTWSYSFNYDGSNWRYNFNVVSISTYGISYEGTPVSGDRIFVFRPIHYMTGCSIYRKSSDNILHYVTTVNSSKTSILDYGAQSEQGPYTYYLYVVGTDTFQTMPAISNETNPCLWNWSILSCTQDNEGNYVVQSSYLFGNNVSSGTISNNNKPNVLGNFTPYPMIQMSQQNYKSGTLQSLIGSINCADGQNTYTDTLDLKDAIYELSTTTNFLFLKSRKGDLWMIRPSADITMETMDSTRAQAQTVRFPWVEVGSLGEASIYR